MQREKYGGDIEVRKEDDEKITRTYDITAVVVLEWANRLYVRIR